MKLDVNMLRYMERDSWRVLTSIEMGMKNHELVPATLVDSIAGLRHGGAYRHIRELLRNKLVHHEGAPYDGYRLTNLGYDYLALRTLVSRGHIAGVGRQIGVGKESDIFEVVNEEGEIYALKLHRLGRTSFRAVRNKRDYLRHGKQHFNWLYLSRLSALKEYAFMRALVENKFEVPKPIDCNRHAVLMTLLPAYPLTQVSGVANPDLVYREATNFLVKLAEHGLIHCDLNEFNLMIGDDEKLTMIDFPQMVSTSHPNAKMYYERDAECLRIFFARKFGLSEEDAMRLAIKPFEELALGSRGQLDGELKASGFNAQQEAALQAALEATKGEATDHDNDADGDETTDHQDEGEEEEEEGDGSSEGPKARPHSERIEAWMASANIEGEPSREAPLAEDPGPATASTEGEKGDADSGSETGEPTAESDAGDDAAGSVMAPSEAGSQAASSAFIRNRILSQKARTAVRGSKHNTRNRNRNKLSGRDKGKETKHGNAGGGGVWG